MQENHHKKRVGPGQTKLQAGPSGNVRHVVLFKAASPRAGNRTAVGISHSAEIALVGSERETTLSWVRGQIPCERRGVWAPRHRGKSQILGQENRDAEKALKQGIP